MIQFGALCMIVMGLFSKFGAVFATIPEPIVGGIFYIMFGMVAAVGLSSLQYVDLNSTRNLFILGFSIFFGLVSTVYLLTYMRVFLFSFVTQFLEGEVSCT